MKAIKPIKAVQASDRWNVHPTADCCSSREAELHAIDNEIRSLSSRIRSAPETDSAPWQTSRAAFWKSGLRESEKRYAEHQLAIAEEYANGTPDSPSRLIGAALFHLRQLRSRLKAWFEYLCCTSNKADSRPTAGAIVNKRSCCRATESSPVEPAE